LVGERGGLRLEGTVIGSPPIYGVIAYFDSLHDGGYRSPTATSVPNAQGKFAIEINSLASCANGDLRVEFCHANGAVSEKHLGFTISPEGQVELGEWELRQALEPVASAVGRNEPAAAKTELERLEGSGAAELTLTVARKLVNSLNHEPGPSPADVSQTVTRLALGDARSISAEVGWLKPAANRIPPNNEVKSVLLDSGKVYATGLYAHAPSKYVFDLGGKWKHLAGEAGLHTLEQPYGSVAFIINADGREIFHSRVIRGGKKAAYDVDVTGVRKLELIVDPAGDGKSNDWGLWLDPMLER